MGRWGWHRKRQGAGGQRSSWRACVALGSSKALSVSTPRTYTESHNGRGDVELGARAVRQPAPRRGVSQGGGAAEARVQRSLQQLHGIFRLRVPQHRRRCLQGTHRGGGGAQRGVPGQAAAAAGVSQHSGSAGASGVDSPPVKGVGARIALAHAGLTARLSCKSSGRVSVSSFIL